MTSVASSTHTVHRGETLSQIARDEGTSVHALLAENPSIHDRNMIHTGQSLKLPDDRASNHQHHSSESRDSVHPSITAQLSPSSASSSSHLRRGDHNAAVGALKRDLQQMGYLTKADSSQLFGVRTERALKAFQSDIGISATGVSGPIASGNLDALAHGVGIGRTSKGEAAESIRAIQSKLFKLGYFDGHPLGKEKGDFGVRTEAAVKSFQKNEGLTVSGRVGASTFAKLQTAKPGGADGATPASLQGRINSAMRFFEGQGWTRAQSAGIVANLQAESNLQNGVHQQGGGPGYGLGQWEGPRQAVFAHWAGHDIHGSSFNEQLRFIQYELTHTEAGAGRSLRGASNAADAAVIVTRQYERPADAAGQSQHRANLARQIIASSAP